MMQRNGVGRKMGPVLVGETKAEVRRRLRALDKPRASQFWLWDPAAGYWRTAGKGERMLVDARCELEVESMADFNERFADYEPTLIDGAPVIGRCESCGAWLVEADEPTEYVDGVCVCQECEDG
jgi:hypothetical protein